MGFFDKIAALGFKTDSQGKGFYFPDGFLGKGYILPDARTKEKAMKFHKRCSVIGIIAGAMFGFFLVSFDPSPYIKIPIVVAFLGFFILIFTIGKRKIIGNLEVSEERMTLKENIRIIAYQFARFWLWLLAIVLLFFVGVFIFLLLNEPEKPWILLFGLILCGPCTILFLYAIHIKKKNM